MRYLISRRDKGTMRALTLSTLFFEKIEKEPQTVAALRKKFFQDNSTKCKESEKTLQKVLCITQSRETGNGRRAAPPPAGHVPHLRRSGARPAALPDLDLLPCQAARLAAANVAPCCTYPKSQAPPRLRPQGKPPPWGGGLGSRRPPLPALPPPALRVSMYASACADPRARADPRCRLLGAGGYVGKRLADGE